VRDIGYRILPGNAFLLPGSLHSNKHSLLESNLLFVLIRPHQCHYEFDCHWTLAPTPAPSTSSARVRIKHFKHLPYFLFEKSACTTHAIFSPLSKSQSALSQITSQPQSQIIRKVEQINHPLWNFIPL
jgi:hypothetical protein